MIKATELRIGNNLCFYKPEQIEPQILTITGIVCEDNGIYYVFSNEYAAINLTSRLMPIHLTPEILEKCGFEKKQNSFIGWNNKPKYSFIKDKLEIGEYWIEDKKPHSQWGCCHFECNFQYLHQLQNLYFALTNEELIVNLNVATSS